MRSCPQCKATYPDNVPTCTRDGAQLEQIDDLSRPIDPTASIPPPPGTEDISLGGLSGASFPSSPENATRAGHPRAARTGADRKRAPSTSMNPEDRVGTTLGSYRLVEVIGRGGMGSVYRAEHVRLPGREVALKLLRADYAQRKDSVARFIREAQSVNRIRHRNIVDVTDIAELDDGTTFIIMELLEGDSLGKLLRKKGALTPARTLNLLMQICDGLAAAHDKDIVHRDLKPDNIFVSSDADGSDLIKLLDFGVAKLLTGHASDVSVHTVAGSVIGTPAFMSPEQAGGLQVDARSDLYSLGAIMYEMFSGKPPFSGKSFGEFVRKHLNENPRPLRHTQGGAQTDPRIEAIVMRCLEKNPARRYQSALELRAELYEVYAALETHTGQFSAPEPPAGHAPPPHAAYAEAPGGGLAGPAALTYTPDPGQHAPFAPPGEAAAAAPPTPFPISPAGTPPTDSLSETADPLPTPPPQTPLPPPSYSGEYQVRDPSGQHPAPQLSGPHSAMVPAQQPPMLSGQHPAITTGQMEAATGAASWKKALVLMLGGGVLVGAIAGLIFSSASSRQGSEDVVSPATTPGAARSPVVTPLSGGDPPRRGTGVTLRIVSEPTDALVYVFRSDEPMCKTPCEFSPGEQGPSVRKYVVAKEGFRSETLEIDLADAPPMTAVTLEPAP
jgi:eukaryotic-like serine/threonine-protein kinase